MPPRTIVCLLALLGATWATSPSIAIAQTNYGILTGVVTDGQGRRVDGAEILITHAGTGLKRDAKTNSQGEFDIVNVQPGTFNVRASKGTQSAERKGVVVGAGQIVRVNADLSTRALIIESSATDSLHVQVVFSTSNSGRTDGAATVGESDAFMSFITADRGLCSLSAGGEPRGVPAIGWRLSGQVLSRAAQEMTVRIEWQRVWDGGVRQTKPRSGTLEAPIRIGERVLLDSVRSPGLTDCGATSGRLEVVVVSRSPGVPPMPGATTGGTGAAGTLAGVPQVAQGGGGRAGTGAGVGSARSGGGSFGAQGLYASIVGTVTDPQGNRVPGASIVITSAANALERNTTTNSQGEYTIVNVQPGTYDIRISMGTNFREFNRRGITVRQGDIARVDTQLASAAGGGATKNYQALARLEEAATKLREAAASDGPLFEAELWLVHTLPDKTERPELIRQPVRESASFVFPSVRLVSRGTSIDLEVFGFVRRVVGDGGAAALQVAIGQRYVGTGSSDNYSGSGKIVSWPAATEVLSFELPADKRLPAGHRFDLRLRLTPR